MKKRILSVVLIAFILSGLAHADCTFTIVNKSDSPVTLQGYYQDGGDSLNNDNWLTVLPSQKIEQVRSGEKCNKGLKHSSIMEAKVALKNNTGYWQGQKGLFWLTDHTYSYATPQALADDGEKITLANKGKVNAKSFFITICKSNVDKDDCK